MAHRKETNFQGWRMTSKKKAIFIVTVVSCMLFPLDCDAFTTNTVKIKTIRTNKRIMMWGHHHNQHQQQQQPFQRKNYFSSRREYSSFITQQGGWLQQQQRIGRRGTSMKMSLLDFTSTAASVAETAHHHHHHHHTYLDSISSSIFITENPKLLEAEVLNDFSHVMLDLAIFLNPATAILRLFDVLGRILSVEADFIADDTITPDELFFQAFMLIVSTTLFLRSVTPIIKSFLVPITDLDRTVFEQLFEPIGVSWIQFKSMKATHCLEWIQVEPGTVLVSEEEALFDQYQNENHPQQQHNKHNNNNKNNLNEKNNNPNFDPVFWLYQGEIQATYKGQIMTSFVRTNGKYIDDPEAMGLIADMRFLYNLDRRRIQKEKKNRNNNNNNKTTTTTTMTNNITSMMMTPTTTASTATTATMASYPMATQTAGPLGATLLRIDSERLFDLMDHDEKLSLSIKTLLLKSLQRKVGNLLMTKAAGSEPSSSLSSSSVVPKEFVSTSSRSTDDSLLAP